MPIDNSTRFPKPLAADLRELSEGMAIVIDGDTAPKAIASGQYLFIKNHSTLATGGYHATAAIASGADITSSNVTPDADGIINGAFSSLSEHIEKLLNIGNLNTELKSLQKGVTEYYTTSAEGWYSIRAYNGNGNTNFTARIGTSSGDILTSITGYGAWNTFATPPIFLPSGMQIQTYCTAEESRKLYRVG